jgi:hypothetical protein
MARRIVRRAGRRWPERGGKRGIQAWAAIRGTSARTLARGFEEKVGMSMRTQHEGGVFVSDPARAPRLFALGVERSAASIAQNIGCLRSENATEPREGQPCSGPNDGGGTRRIDAAS